MTTKQRTVLTVLLCVILGIISCKSVNSAEELSLTFHQTGTQYQSDTAYIASFYGDNQIITDTIIGDNSVYRYSFAQDAPSGIYRFLINDSVFFDFIYNHETIEMKGELSPYSSQGMVVQKSDENKALQSYLSQLSDYYNLVESKKNEFKQCVYKDKIAKKNAGDSLNRLLVEGYNNLTLGIDSSPKLKNSIASLTVHVLHLPRYSNYVVMHDDKTPLLSEQDYNIKHLTDNIPFSDGRILFSPYYYMFIQSYFSNFVNDSSVVIKRATAQLLERARVNPKVFDFTVEQATNILNMLGKDDVVYYVLDSVIGQNSCTESMSKDFSNKIKQLENLRSGKPAPEFTLTTETNQPITLSKLTAEATILYFWKSDCDFCKQTTPKLVDVLTKLGKADIKVVAVSLDSDKQAWQKARITTNDRWINACDTDGLLGVVAQQYLVLGTPTMYLLDSKKNIIKRVFSVSDLEIELKKISKK